MVRLSEILSDFSETINNKMILLKDGLSTEDKSTFGIHLSYTLQIASEKVRSPTWGMNPTIMAKNREILFCLWGIARSLLY